MNQNHEMYNTNNSVNTAINRLGELFPQDANKKDRFPFENDLLPILGRKSPNVYRFEGPICENLPHTIVVTIDEKLPEELKDVATYAESRREMILGATDGIELLKKEPVILADGVSAEECCLKMPLTRETLRIVQYFYVTSGNRGATFTCVYTKQSFRQLSPLVRQCIEELLTPDATLTGPFSL